MQKQTIKQEVMKADMNMVSDIYELVHKTIQNIYKQYYSEEAVQFFLRLHSKENIAADISEGHVYVAVHEHTVVGTGSLDKDHIKRLFVLPEFQGQGIGTRIMDFLEAEIIKNYGAAWLDSSLPAGKFYHDRGYITKKYEEIQLENGKVLAYEIMCRTQFPIDPDEFDAPSQLVRREMELPGIATQVEDLMAAGAEELIHVGFAGGYPGMRIGDVVITDGAFHDTAVAVLYGCTEEIARSDRELTDSFCKEMDAKGIAYRRGFHRTTDAGYVQPDWSAKYYARKGVLCVEMEGAGLFAAAKFRSCRATGIYVISDSGSGDDWNLGWGEKVLETSINRVIEAVAGVSHEQ